MFCPYCGNQISDDAGFCSKCGKSVLTGKSISQENTISQNKSRLKIIIPAVIVLTIILSAIVFCCKPREIPEINNSISEKPVVGKTYIFGRYPQSSDVDIQDILWDVIAEENGSYMLLSHYVLDSYPYNINTENFSMDWYSSDVYNWLNTEFASEAFNEEEMGRMSGDVTLLSIADIEKYFPYEMFGDYRVSGKLACSPTDYAHTRGVESVSIEALTSPSSSYNTSLFEAVRKDIDLDTQNNIAKDWMLRDTGASEGRDNMIYNVQFVIVENNVFMTEEDGIRPVIWIH